MKEGSNTWTIRGLNPICTERSIILNVPAVGDKDVTVMNVKYADRSATAIWTTWAEWISLTIAHTS